MDWKESAGHSFSFDIRAATECVKNYRSATGIDVFLIDARGDVLFSSLEHGLCSMINTPIIRTAGRCGTGLCDCRKAHLYGSYQAERFGGRYIYFCPLGLTHWAVPIVVHGIIQGAFLGGPVLMTDPDDYMVDEILANNGLKWFHANEVKELLSSLPIVEPSRVTALSELLYVSAAYVSDGAHVRFDADKENLSRQSEISEYLQVLKKAYRSHGDSEYPIGKERELLSCISLGDKAGAQEILNIILGHVFFSSGRKTDVVKARIIELLVLLSRAAVQGGARIEEIFGLNMEYIKQIDAIGSVDDLAVWLTRIMLRFTDCVFNMNDIRHVDVIYKSLDFIRKHYMEKLPLKDVADHTGLSASYFSKVFKNEIGMSFNAYLNAFRIEVSKEMLLDDIISLVDIAFEVGFEDQSYFTKVFKKITGVSPGRYRETRGRCRESTGPPIYT